MRGHRLDQHVPDLGRQIGQLLIGQLLEVRRPSTVSSTRIELLPRVVLECLSLCIPRPVSELAAPAGGMLTLQDVRLGVIGSLFT